MKMREWLESLFSESDEAVVLLDGALRIQWSNLAGAKLLNIQFPKDQGQYLSALLRFPELQDLFKNSEAVQHTLFYKTYTDVSLRLRYTPLKGEGGVLFASRDRLRKRMEKILHSFGANLSHEMRTPLTIIDGYLELLSENKVKEEEFKQVISDIRGQGKRLLLLLENLLELTKIESLNQPAKSEKVFLKDLCERVCQDMQSLAKGKKLTLHCPGEVFLMGKSEFLYSIIRNLLDNALRSVPNEKGHVKLLAERKEDNVIIRVQDNGPGIASQDLPRITERFYRIGYDGDVAQNKGFGLGLAIVKHALNYHGGRLEIDSEPLKGSEFRCIFPLE